MSCASDNGRGRSLPVTSLKGVGPAVARAMAKKGIGSVDDLLYFLPLRWVERAGIRKICDVSPGEEASIIAVVDSYRSMFFRHARKKGYEVIVSDGTGYLSLKWFQWSKGYLQRICRKGASLVVSGKVGLFGATLQIVHPDVVFMDDDEDADGAPRVTPVYSQIDGVKQGSLRRIITEAMGVFEASPRSIIPEDAEAGYGLMSLADAMRRVHVTGTGEFSKEEAQRAVERMIMEEYLHFQVRLAGQRRAMHREKGIAFTAGGPLFRAFMERLDFDLTAAQERVIAEILSDMQQAVPMNRLLQGDVGSGKTVCAVASACVAIDNGFQVAFMAPTEILAEQHYFNVHRWFEGLGLKPALLKGGMGRSRRGVLEEIRKGAISVVIGTHAVIQSDVEFQRLGLIIIDEQHRFGVEQRKKLRDKSIRPHILGMTATPIPRTLSMVIYGDLDVSVIDAMPAGRQKVATKVIADNDRSKAGAMIRQELVKGCGVFIVYPLVEGSEKTDLKDATTMASHLQKKVFPEYRVDLLHGRMSADDKEKAMQGFREGTTDILVCTTVIEVGIDVPRATMIVVEHAERFGLSQLHQLRGRVGRCSDPSKCLLIASTTRTDIATKRLRIMEKTNDGFAIAEEDLRIRGVGDMLGVRQSGLPPFRVGDIIRDIDIMIEAKKVADDFTSRLGPEELAGLLERIGSRFDDARDLSEIA